MIFFDRSLKVQNLGAKVINFLVRYEPLSAYYDISLQILSVHFQLRFVRLQLPLRLLKICLKRPWIDNEQKVSLLHLLAFLEMNFGDSARYLRLDIDGLRRTHTAKLIDLDRHIHSLDRCHENILRRLVLRTIRFLAT